MIDDDLMVPRTEGRRPIRVTGQIDLDRVVLVRLGIVRADEHGVDHVDHDPDCGRLPLEKHGRGRLRSTRDACGGRQGHSQRGTAAEDVAQGTGLGAGVLSERAYRDCHSRPAVWRDGRYRRAARRRRVDGLANLDVT